MEYKVTLIDEAIKGLYNVTAGGGWKPPYPV
jgi:hypothetical protein